MPYQPVEEVKRGTVKNPEALALMKRVYENTKDLESPGFFKALAMKVGLMEPDHMMVANKDIYAMNALIYSGADTDSSRIVGYEQHPDYPQTNAGKFEHGSQDISYVAQDAQSMAGTLLHELDHKEDVAEGAYDNPGNFPKEKTTATYLQMPTELKARATALAGEYARNTGKIPPWNDVQEEILERGGQYGMQPRRRYESQTPIGGMAYALRNIESRRNDTEVNQLLKERNSKHYQEVAFPVSQQLRDSLFTLTKQAFEDVATRSGYR